MRLLLLSDTHNRHPSLTDLPEADAVLHAGDVSGRGTLPEIGAFLTWFGALPYRHKVFIAGNHDFAFERQAAVAEALVPPGVTYLRDQAVSLDGLTVWGAPWQPWFMDWAFNLERGPALEAAWARIPDDVDVLLTHGPPHGILDQTSARPPERVGCADLRRRIASLSRLRLHAFGHIHEAYGIERHGDVTFVNASTCDLRYEPRNAPVVVEV